MSKKWQPNNLVECLKLLDHYSFEEPTATVSYGAISYIDEPISSIIINGEGGILGVYPHSGGAGGMCCVVIPEHWHPGLKVTIKWLGGGSWLKDNEGKLVIRNGKKVLVQGPWKQKTVDIPEYKEADTVAINFFPHDEVKVLVTKWGPGSPNYPYPVPNPNHCWDGIENMCKGK